MKGVDFSRVDWTSVDFAEVMTSRSFGVVAFLYFVLGMGFYFASRDAGAFARFVYFALFPVHAIIVPICAAFIRGMVRMFRHPMFLVSVVAVITAFGGCMSQVSPKGEGGTDIVTGLLVGAFMGFILAGFLKLAGEACKGILPQNDGYNPRF
jgi:hypothetical protein